MILVPNLSQKCTAKMASCSKHDHHNRKSIRNVLFPQNITRLSVNVPLQGSVDINELFQCSQVQYIHLVLHHYLFCCGLQLPKMQTWLHSMVEKSKVLLDASNVHDASCICTFYPITSFPKRESHGFHFRLGDIRASKEWTLKMTLQIHH